MRDERFRELWATGISTEAICERLGFTRVREVTDRARTLGLPPRMVTKPRKDSSKADALIRNLWLKGVPADKIAQQLGYKTRVSVCERARKLGLPKRRRSLAANRDEVITRMWLEGIPAAAIAKTVGYRNVCNVSDRVEILGLPSRNAPKADDEIIAREKIIAADMKFQELLQKYHPKEAGLIGPGGERI